MVLGKNSRGEGTKLSNYCSTVSVAVFVAFCLVGVWIIMSTIVPIQNPVIQVSETISDVKDVQSDSKQFEERSGDIPEESTEGDSQTLKPQSDSFAESQNEQKEIGEVSDKMANENQEVVRESSDAKNDFEKDPGNTAEENDQMRNVKPSTDEKEKESDGTLNSDSAETETLNGEIHNDELRGSMDTLDEKESDKSANDNKLGTEKSMDKVTQQDEIVNETEEETAKINTHSETTQSSGESNTDSHENNQASKNDFITDTQSETLIETSAENGTWSTQATESQHEKESQKSSVSIDSRRYDWKLCNTTTGSEYIPCLDNWQAIRRLQSIRHYEHRERHCPDEATTCLVSLPEGYRSPIRWPKSREMIWYKNAPHTKLVEVKGHQNWVKDAGEYLTFPGGGTQFKHGALHYIEFIQKSLPKIAWGKRSRVILDVGCGVASFGGYLFEKDVLTMSFAPKDVHEAQVQFALERGIPATLGVMGTVRLPYPASVFDLVHCARCRVPWHLEGGRLLLELNRVLRPGGYFVWSATPVYQKDPESVEIWKAMGEITVSMCWDLVVIAKDKLNGVAAAIYRKPTDNECYNNRIKNEPPMCNESDDPNQALKWAAIERLPTYDRLRTSILQTFAEGDHARPNTLQHREVDVRKLDVNERQEFIDRIFKVAEEDNEKYLSKFRNRLEKVGIRLPTVEVRFQNLTVEADSYVGSRALPTLPNVALNIAESALGLCGISTAKRRKLTILKDVSGIIKPSRMALLLGPPSSGKTTLLLALAGKLDNDLRVRGEISYNGYKLNEFVPRKTSAYISQNDVHIGEMTVKETFDFSARCQGVGTRYDLLAELARREKEAGIFPEAELDLFMKATAMEGTESSLITDYTLKILGLDICKDTIVGDEMHRGVSGGQKKRVTTGEMIVGPTKTLLMDEISTGLDSSTTYQIVKCFQQIVHLTEATIFMSLLQPAPETFDLFDDIILISEGQIVYQGPREHIIEFFESCGFRCPERKGTADFLQEVTSRKDQEQYWINRNIPYHYITVSEFANRFKQFHVGMQLENELSVPFDKSKGHRAALVFKKYTVPTMGLLKACWDKELLLIKRNSFVYIFKTAQICIIGIIAATVFFRTKMHQRDESDAAVYIGAILFTMIMNMFNGFSELPLTIARLPVFYKHRDHLFHPPWTYTLPNFLLRIPISIFEAIVWVLLTYYPIGFAPEASRFFKHLLLVFLVQQMAAGMFRLISGVCRTMIIANTGGALMLLLVFLLGGFILPKRDIRDWWIWGYWISPLTYAYNGLTVNELFAPRWSKPAKDGVTPIGLATLNNFDVFAEKGWYWIGVAVLLAFTVLYNVLFTFALMYLNPIGKKQAIISEEEATEMETGGNSREEPRLLRPEPNREIAPQPLYSTDGNNTREVAMQQMSGRGNPSGMRNVDSMRDSTLGVSPKKGMVLPFQPLAMSFDSVNYYVDMPAEMKEQGVTEDRLQLLREVTGAFRPGVLTALMGVSGAGKTTLMDVLAGRKTGGYIEGDVRISGYPKNQETFARISGYCEQTDIHSPQVTIRESLIYSAFLRLPREVNNEEKMKFVDEVMDLVELDNLKDAIVGLPGVTGLSTEQRKRLTIAVELVANPSIIFMDEPTSGLDARAAAIVMRTVRNTVDTGRTVVCTIHQPSIDIFEAFDELLLMKRGGQVIYSGPLGRNSHKIIEYFEAIPGVPKIKDKYNPATWMLEVSSIAAEVRLGMDFAEYYKTSSLYQRNKALIRELSTPPPGAKDLYFPTQYSQSTWEQFKSCLWKQWLTYWRSPDYNLVRFFFTLAVAFVVGTVFWRVGKKRGSSSDLNTIIGALYGSIFFVGVNNCQTVQPVVAVERTVFYRERAAGMYSALPYAIAQVISEIPYVFVQTIYFAFIVYAMVSFEWKVEKVLWFFFVSFFSFLYFTYYGMMTVSITPNHQVASIFGAAFYGLFNLFSGFFIPRPKIPKWWVWYYWICPVAWTVYGLIVSQYRDVEITIFVPGENNQTIKHYIEDHYGFKPNFMGPVAIVLVAFPVFFAFIFAFSIKTLNFQTR